MKLKLTAYFMLSMLFSINTYSQSFSLNELLSLSKMDLDNFDTNVTIKGYNFKEAKDLGICNLQAYSYDDTKGDEGLGFYWIELEYDFKEGDKKSYLLYQTIYKNDYLSIKKSILANQFKFIDNEVNLERGGIKLSYVKGKTQIDITSKISNDTNRNLYIVEIYNFN